MNVLKFDPKHCERIRGQLDAYLSNELLVETTSEVFKHLETCEDCSRELDSRARLREALRRAVAKQLPPEGLREAVHESLHAAQSGYFRGWRATSWALAVAALALVIFAGAAGQRWLKVRRGRQLVSSILALGVSDHLQCAIKAHNYPEAANPPDKIRAKLGPEYAGLLQVVEARLPGFQVLEAHICSVSGSPRKYVHFITRGRGTILSVILTKRDREDLPAERFLVAETSSGVNLYRAHLDAMDVAGFESKDYFGFVVSDLGQNEVMQIATKLAPAVRNALGETIPAADSETPVSVLYPDRVLRAILDATDRTSATGAELATLGASGRLEC
jgi:anti-sigma factor (TIGR02949 family)